MTKRVRNNVFFISNCNIISYEDEEMWGTVSFGGRRLNRFRVRSARIIFYFLSSDNMNADGKKKSAKKRSRNVSDPADSSPRRSAAKLPVTPARKTVFTIELRGWPAGRRVHRHVFLMSVLNPCEYDRVLYRISV